MKDNLRRINRAGYHRKYKSKQFLCKMQQHFIFSIVISQRALSRAKDVAPTMQATGNKYFHSFRYLYFMPVKQTIPYNSGIFFITFTCHQWLPLIDKTNGYDIVYNWFDHLKSKGHYINGFVIMPNHVHALISFIDTKQCINTIIGNGKRFMAYEIIERLKKTMKHPFESVGRQCKSCKKTK